MDRVARAPGARATQSRLTTRRETGRIRDGMRPSLIYFPLLALFFLSLGTAAEGFHGRLVVEDFEAFAWGETWAAVQFSPSADPRMKTETDEVLSGRQACRLDVPPGETLTLVAQHGARFIGPGDKAPLPLPGVPERIGVWVHGQRGGHRLWLRVADAAGRPSDVALGPVDFDGWGFLDGPIPGPSAQMGLRALLVRGGEGPLVLDNITITTTAASPLHLTLRPATPGRDLIASAPVEFLVTLQSLAPETTRGLGALSAFDPALPGPTRACARFQYEVSAARPCAATVPLRLPAGVHRLAAETDGARALCQVVVHPAKSPTPLSAPAALRRFGRPAGALRLIESALSPAVVIEGNERTLTLFRGLPEAGLRAPQHLLARVRPQSRELEEPWMVFWFGAAPEHKQVTLADGAPCPTFDVPVLLVLDRAPASWKLEDCLELQFRRPGFRAALMPLLGIRRAEPALTAAWNSSAEAMARVADACRTWGPLLRAIPIAVTEEYRVDSARDMIEVRVRFDYHPLSDRWGPARRRVAPVPPVLMLAKRAGLAVRFSKDPVPTGCLTSVGPYYVVPDTDSYTYSISGLLHFVLTAVADVPRGVPGAQIALGRSSPSLSDDAPKIPFWVAYGGEAGKWASDALSRLMLSPSNAAYACDSDPRRPRAADGLLAQTQGAGPAEAAVADCLQGCWYTGLHAGLWEELRPRWRQILALRQGAAEHDDWATLGLGSRPWPADVRLASELYFARLAAHLAGSEDYTRGCAQAVKLLVAAYALVAGAPRYVEEMAPWPDLAGGRNRVFSACRPGSLGFAQGPPPFVTHPTDAGYGFAAEFLGEYYRERFRSGPLDYFGQSPAEWSQRLFVTMGGPEVGRRFLPAEPLGGPFATNYVFSVEEGPDGWPAVVWRSHRAPAGGPLTLGGVGGPRASSGRLIRRQTVSASLRVSAYEAIEAPPSPTAPESQPPQAPAAPSTAGAGGRPDRNRP